MQGKFFQFTASCTKCLACDQMSENRGFNFQMNINICDVQTTWKLALTVKSEQQ